MIKLNSEALSTVSSGIILIEPTDKSNGEIFVYSRVPLKLVAQFYYHSEEEKSNALFHASQIDRKFYDTDEYFPLLFNNL